MNLYYLLWIQIVKWKVQKGKNPFYVQLQYYQNFCIFSASSFPVASEVRKRTRDDQNEDRFKKDGKIHSFKQTDNDDDENNTWNGNSTQQM